MALSALRAFKKKCACVMPTPHLIRRWLCRQLAQQKGMLDCETREEYLWAMWLVIEESSINHDPAEMVIAADYQRRLAEMREKRISRATFRAAWQSLKHFGINPQTKPEFQARLRWLIGALCRLEAIQGPRNSERQRADSKQTPPPKRRRVAGSSDAPDVPF